MRNKDLTAHSLARAFVERVGDDAYDLGVQLGLRTDAVSDALANGAGALEEVLGKLAVDDSDPGVLFEVGALKVPALENRDLHRREVPRRQRVHERLHVLAVGRTVAFD
jgi:hypothetical protein